MTETLERKVVAVSVSAFNAYGCPHCGGIFGSSSMSGGGASVWNCADCDQTTTIVNDDLKQSPIGHGSGGGETVYPLVEAHPRAHLPPVNREKIAQDRKDAIKGKALTDLRGWLSLGYSGPMRYEEVGEHSSKSQKLPIIASQGPSNVLTTWFGNNYHFYFLGVALQKAIPAPLLYPVSGIFGGYALSGHVNTDLAPPVTNFEKLYHNHTLIDRFGAGCGDGFMAACVVRYLEEISKIDQQAILDTCFNKTSIGKVDVVDGNYIEFGDLLKKLNIEGGELYKEKVLNAPSGVFEEISLSWFGTRIGGKPGILVTMKEGVYFPAIPTPGDITVSLTDTSLVDVSDEAKERFSEKNERIPTNFLAWRRDNHPARWQLSKHLYAVNGLHQKTNLGTRSFALHTPNQLDLALTCFFLMKVVAPLVLSFTKK